MKKSAQVATYLPQELYDDFTTLAHANLQNGAELLRELAKKAVDENRKAIEMFRELRRQRKEKRS